MPVLRRPHARHRDIPRGRSGARAAVCAPLIRDDGVVTRRDDPQPTVEAAPLRPSGGHTSTSTASSTTVLMTVRSAGLSLWHRPIYALTDRLLCSPSSASVRPHAPRHLRRYTRILKSP